MKFATVVAVIAGLAVSGVASAQNYPTRPIKMIVPYGAGGPSDVIARVLSHRMAEILGQNIIIENHGGAGGSIGGRFVSSSTPDGYTLMFGATGPLVISPIIFHFTDYDPAKTLAPVVLVGTTSNILLVTPSLPVHSVKELIAYAKANPGKLSFSSPGVGTPGQLIGEMLKLKTGIDMLHVPYKGGAGATQAVIGGEVQLTFENPAGALAMMRGKTLRALAVTSSKRSPLAPELPTMIESGVPGFVSVSFTGIAAPIGTPEPIIRKINAAANESLKDPAVKAALQKLAVDIQGGSPEEFRDYLADERKKWGEVVAAAHIKAR
jgi:tripartite-type tricarboxylate transporter receptor subunit TctC